MSCLSQRLKVARKVEYLEGTNTAKKWLFRKLGILSVGLSLAAFCLTLSKFLSTNESR